MHQYVLFLLGMQEEVVIKINNLKTDVKESKQGHGVTQPLEGHGVTQPLDLTKSNNLKTDVKESKQGHGFTQPLV